MRIAPTPTPTPNSTPIPTAVRIPQQPLYHCTGLARIPKLGLGTGLIDEDIRRALPLALKLGYRLVDCCSGPIGNEDTIGELLQQVHSQLEVNYL